MSSTTETRARNANRPCPATRTAREMQRTGVPMDAANPGTFVRDSIIFMRDLKDSPFRLYCMMRSHVWETNKDRTVAITSAELESMMGRSRSTIWRYLENLRDVGLIGLHEQRVWWVYQGATSGHAERRTMNVYAVFDVPLPGYDGPRTVKDVRQAFEGKHGPRAGDRVHVRSGSGERVIEHFNPNGPNPSVPVADADEATPTFPAFDQPVPTPAHGTDEVSIVRADEPATTGAPTGADTGDADTGATTPPTPRNGVLAGQTDVSNVGEPCFTNDTPYKNAFQDSGGEGRGARARAIEGERVDRVSAASWDVIADVARTVLPRDQALTEDEYQRLAMMCEHARQVVASHGRVTWDEYEQWLRHGWVTSAGVARYKTFVGTLTWRLNPDQINGKALAWVYRLRGEREAEATRGTREKPVGPVPTCERHTHTPLSAVGRCWVCEDEHVEAAQDRALPAEWGTGPAPSADQFALSLAGAGVGATTTMERPQIDSGGRKGGSGVRGRTQAAQAAWGALKDVLGDRVGDDPEWVPLARR